MGRALASWPSCNHRCHGWRQAACGTRAAPPGREVMPMELLTDLIKLVTAIIALATVVKKAESTDGDDDLKKDEDR